MTGLLTTSRSKANLSKAYLVSMAFYMEAVRSGSLRKVSIETYSTMEYNTEDTGIKKQVIFEDLVVIKTGWLTSLTPKTRAVAIQMSEELCKNNALWYYEPETAHNRRIIAELRRFGVIVPTEDKAIHFVNPAFMRKGSRPGVLAMTMKELEDCPRVSKANIRNLRNMKAGVNPFHALENSILPTGDEIDEET